MRLHAEDLVSLLFLVARWGLISVLLSAGDVKVHYKQQMADVVTQVRTLA
jgi:hypothetical protein